MIVDFDSVMYVLSGIGLVMCVIGLWMAADIKRLDRRIAEKEAEIRRQGLPLPGE